MHGLFISKIKQHFFRQGLLNNTKKTSLILTIILLYNLYIPYNSFNIRME